MVACPSRPGCLLPDSVFSKWNYKRGEWSAGGSKAHRAGPCQGVQVHGELWGINTITWAVLRPALRTRLFRWTINHRDGAAHRCVSAGERWWQAEWFLTSRLSQASIRPFQHDSILLTTNAAFLLHWFECWLRRKAYFLEQQETQWIINAAARLSLGPFRAEWNRAANHKGRGWFLSSTKSSCSIAHKVFNKLWP